MQGVVCQSVRCVSFPKTLDSIYAYWERTTAVIGLGVILDVI